MVDAHRAPDEARDDRTRGVFAISVAAEMASMQIHNLRVYEQRGLVAPARTAGGTRLYSRDDITVLIRIGDLLTDGLNLAGIAMVLTLEARLDALDATAPEPPASPQVQRRGPGRRAAGRSGG